MAKIKQLRENNIPFYPVTIPDAIVFENGDNLNEKVSNLENELDTIEQLIPEQANPQNQLADKEFVNSSIATNTAQFRGTFNTLNELNAVEADTNDYGFVVDTDASGNTLYNRYKYNGDSWVFEYTLNNSSFTAEQWEAINSGITTSLVDKLTELPTNSQLTETLNSKADKATTVTNVAYSNNKITKTINGVTSDVVSIDTIKQDLNLTKSDVGLSNVDNTSDSDKPISTATQNALDGKVDKVNGKGLSTNDYTTDDKNKLHSIADGAQVNVLEGVKVNGTELTIDNEKKVNVIVPTKTSDLTNDDNTVKDPNYVHTDNNFTDVYKNKVDNSQENVIEHIKVNGTEQQIVEKTVDITVPTDLSDLNDANHRLVTDAEKTAWNAKYDKPSVGIPKADLSNSVQRSLDKADTALQEHQDISGKADKSSLATVATTGKYEDLIGGPDLTGYATEQWVTNQNYITDVSGKADKSEMSVSTNGDKTTIQLKAGTSATVINAHQDISGKQDVITDLSTIRSGAAAGATAYQKPSTGIPKSDLATDVQTSLNKADTALQSHQDLSHITNLIPTQASSSNQLADKDFVNSSVSTATATFRGTSAAGLNQTQFFNWANGLTKDLNDYVFWNTTDSNGNTVYKRYKYDGTNWVFEYDLNNSSFTSEQWSAINSGITNTHVTKLNGIAAGAEVNVQSDWNETNTSSDAYIKNKPANLVQDANYVHTDNNYTTTEKNKLSGIASNAQVNVLEGVQVNGTDLTITNKKVNVSVPTKTSQLTNDDNVVKDASYVHTDNNYTTTEKNKLSGIASGAQVNVIEGVQVNGTDLPITTNKKVNVDLSGKVDKVSGKGLSTYDVVDYAVLINSVNDKSESQITLRRTGSSVNNNVTVGTTIAEKTKIENSVTDVQINGVTQAKSGSVVNLDLSNKVNVAESTSHTDDEFVYRQTGGGLDIEAKNARIDKIKGKTLAWNQVLYYNFSTLSGLSNSQWLNKSVSNGILTLENTASEQKDAYIEYNFQTTENLKELVVGHKYLWMIECYREIAYSDGTAIMFFPGVAQSGGSRSFSSYGKWEKLALVKTIVSGSIQRLRFYCITPGATHKYRNSRLIDVTLLYGSEIDGMTDTQILNKYEADFGTGYHEYNAGTLISNDASALETVGFNQWDEEWENGALDNNGVKIDATSKIRTKNYIPVFPNTNYYIYINGACYLCFYDANKNFISAIQPSTPLIFLTPANAAFIMFNRGNDYGSVYNHDICINLSDPAKNGTYEPYRKSTMQLGLNSIKVKSHNIWDEEWEVGYIETDGTEQQYNTIRSKNYNICIPGESYYGKLGSNGQIYITWYDADKNFIVRPTITNAIQVAPSNARYFRLSTDSDYGTTYNNDICINVSSSFNGQYEPHGDITITGGLKSAGNVYDEIIGDKYIKRIGEVDLGTLSTDKIASFYVAKGQYLFQIDDKKESSNAGLISNKYAYSSSRSNTNPCMTNLVNYGWSVYIGDDILKSKSSAEVKVLMSGVILQYELTTPIEYEIIAPTNFDYPVDKLGTERVISDTVPTPPFRADITYHESNIKDIEIEGITEYLKRSELSDWITSNKPVYSLSEITNADDVKAIENLTGTGLLKRTGDNTWALDNTSYASASALSNYLPLAGGTMSNTNLVTNLNADLLDGYHLSGIRELPYVPESATDANLNSLTQGRFFAGNLSSFGGWSGGITFTTGISSRKFQLIGNAYGALAYRAYSESWSAWKTIAFTDSNVASATKLETARTIWGQSFDGTANISGQMSSVTNIDSLLYFDTTNSRVGIGTSSPAYKLDVNGIARATQIITPSISNPSGISITADYIGLEATGDSLDFTSPDSFNFSGGGDMYITNNNVYANGFVKTGGTSSQFLKADGSVDSNTYLSTASLSGYLPLTGGTITGSLTVNNRITTGNIGSGSYQNWHIKDDSDINSSSNNLEIYTEDELRINAGSIEISADDVTINNVYDLNFGQIKISTYQNTFIIDNAVTKSRYLIHLDGTNSGDYVEFERY